MHKSLKLFGLLILSVSAQIASAQTNKEKAFEMGTAAIKLMDSGKIEESIKLLEEAKKLDPANLDYPYELAFAYQLKKDYKKAIKIAEWLVMQKDNTDQMFQMLGNCYDYNGQSDKAMEAYEAGLKKFPGSGKLYVEMGNVFWGKKEYGKALPFYEKGIEVDPTFPSNYYRAARIYCGSTEEVWGMIYGEIFMNLERNSERTAEMSKLLYTVYKSEIKFTSDTSSTISFCQNASINVNDLKNPKKLKLPFGMLVYEPTMLMGVALEKNIDLSSLDRIRTRFIENYFKMGHDKTYPNVLFDYQDKIKKAGHLEAYNYWILMKGNEDEFGKWEEANKAKWDNFVDWFNENQLVINDKNKFYREQY